MRRVSIALVAVCLVASHVMAQPAGVWGGYRNAYGSRLAVARTMLSGRNLGVRQNLDGSVCVPAPYYEYCDYAYNYYALDSYRAWPVYPFWNGSYESNPPQPSYTIQSPQPPPPPPPPVTPVLHEYNWPEQENASATFSIVTTGGTVYLATMVWMEGGDVHFNSVDGGVRQIPLSSVSGSLTETANAQKNLNLNLPRT